ncbi:MAG: hypothetical protein KME10_19310 [Plectolyngbya sp. WJT66-NPBG17]|jgi:hypothetical protein|nr:hypothetical protein [Plectolyngbya sp. WJT66-NPBG17]MBW4527893.1 hypothetical protein [Phormidium tanganyikae FI6-MK23]
MSVIVKGIVSEHGTANYKIESWNRLGNLLHMVNERFFVTIEHGKD